MSCPNCERLRKELKRIQREAKCSIGCNWVVKACDDALALPSESPKVEGVSTERNLCRQPSLHPILCGCSKPVASKEAVSAEKTVGEIAREIYNKAESSFGQDCFYSGTKDTDFKSMKESNFINVMADALRTERERAQTSVQEFIDAHHNPIVNEKNKQLSSLSRRVERMQRAIITVCNLKYPDSNESENLVLECVRGVLSPAITALDEGEKK